MSHQSDTAPSETAVPPATTGAPRPLPFTPPTPSAASCEPPLAPQTIILRKDRAPIWPHQMDEVPVDLSHDMFEPEIARRVATYTDEVHAQFPCTATEIQTFANCPRQFYWRHYEGLQHGRILGGDLEEITRYRVNLRRGSIIHLYLERHQHGWSDEAMRRALRDSILRSLDFSLPNVDVYVEDMLADVRRFLASEQYETLRAADEVLREARLVLRVPGQPGCVIEARPDVVYRYNRSWYVMDYKTANFGTQANPLLAILDDTTRYELQAAIYLTALRQHFGRHGIANFTFFYTAHGVAVQETPSDAWLDGAMALMPSISRWMQKRMFGPIHPAWSARKCHGCSFRGTVCKPFGDPAGAVR